MRSFSMPPAGRLSSLPSSLPSSVRSGAALALAGWLGWIGHAHAQDPVSLQPQQRQKLGIQTVAVQPAQERGRLVLQGVVEMPPQLLRVLSAPVAALVEQVQVSKGDAVRPGQAVLSLHAPQVLEWQRDHQQAQLQLNLARQTAERDAALLAEGIVPAARAQASQAQLKLAQALVQERAQQLQLAGVSPQAPMSGRLSVSAPGRGAVVEVMVQAGQRVDAGTALLKFAAEGPLDVALQATGDEARRLRVGDQVKVPGCANPARLLSINPLLEGGTQMVAVRARWPRADGCVWPQQRVQAEVVMQDDGHAAGWRVPATAVVRHEGRDLVFVQRGSGQYLPTVVVTSAQAPAQGGQAALVQVRTAAAQAIQPQDQVVSQGAIALKGMLQGLGAE